MCLNGDVTDPVRRIAMKASGRGRGHSPRDVVSFAKIKL